MNSTTPTWSNRPFPATTGRRLDPGRTRSYAGATLFAIADGFGKGDAAASTAIDPRPPGSTIIKATTRPAPS